jgi:predicted nucleic acid-binding protein
VDASVAAKWFLPEQWSGEAYLLRSQDETLIAPDILIVELTRVILRKVRRRDLSEAAARDAFLLVAAQPVELRPTAALIALAFDIGLKHQRDAYDAIYVALALQERCTLVTADRILYDALVGAYPDTLIWVGDLADHLAKAP